MAQIIQPVKGTVVAAVAQDYSMQDRDNPRLTINGVTRRVWVVEDPSADPVSVKFREDDLASFNACTPGSRVEITCVLRANKNVITHQFDKLDKLDGKGPTPAASAA